MKLLLALALLGACGASSKESSSTTTGTSTSGSNGNGTTTTGGGTGTPTGTGTTNTTQASAGKTPYSCFTYSQRGSTVKRSACMRTDECDPYLEQARQVGGIVADGGCASVSVLYCFHQAATKDEPQGLDVCQPSVDACKSERELLVKKGSSVDTDCAQR